MDDGWYIGQLREVPNVLSQAETLAELEENIRDAYELVVKDHEVHPGAKSMPIYLPA